MLEKNWITVTEAATIVGCSASRIRALCAEALLKAEKMGPRAWLVDRNAAEKLARTPARTGRPRKNQK